MKLYSNQQQIVKSKARFKIIRAGRRAGKSTYSIEEMLFTAMQKANSNVFYIAPTQIQARKIIWEALKNRLDGIGEINEARLEMKIPTVDGGHSIIYVLGWENRENVRGMKAHLIVFDELDTMRDFFVGWQAIFRPMLTDTVGKCIFIGTPKKENPNLKRLEKVAETDKDYAKFHFKTEDNPHIPPEEIDKARKELDYETFKQEYEAEYLENKGALFRYTHLLDLANNTVEKGEKYLIVDVAGDGNDKTIFSLWDGKEEYDRHEYAGLTTESIVQKIRDIASVERVPYSHIAIDAIGIGEGVANASLLTGVIGYKSSYAAIKTDVNIVAGVDKGFIDRSKLVTDFKNLRSQCVFKLADMVNKHEIASKVGGAFREYIIEELSLYQDVSTGDGKRQATAKENIKEVLGRSPDHSDCFLMRMYFELVEQVSPNDGEDISQAIEAQKRMFIRNRDNLGMNSAR